MMTRVKQSLGKGALVGLLVCVSLWVAGCQQGDAATSSASDPTRVRSASPAATAVPTPTPCPPYHSGETRACGPGVLATTYQRDFLRWTPDGARLIFNYDEVIWTLEMKTGKLQKVIDVRPYDRNKPFDETSGYGFHADVSPDGGQIAYSTCEYEWKVTPRPCAIPVRPNVYEIGVIDVDGNEQRRITNSPGIDHYPAWSPDGSRIAMVTAPTRYGNDRYFAENSRVVVMPAEGSKEPRIGIGVPSPRGAALFPPVWSPDGERLAFIVSGDSNRSQDRERSKAYKGVIFTYAIARENLPRTSVKVDGITSEFGEATTEIGETTTVPAWAPDSSRLAFAGYEAGIQSIYTATPDGGDLRQIYRREAAEPITQLLWSPDGGELLAVADGLWTISADGSQRRELAAPSFPADQTEAVVAAWSLDGTRIAVSVRSSIYSLFPLILMDMDRTGRDVVVRAVTERDAEGNALLVGRKPEHTQDPVDTGICAAGKLVPQPEANPGLVEDCGALLEIRRRLTDPETTNWKDDRPITSWDGVEVGGSPPRVHDLWNERRVWFNTFPAELVRLTELRAVGLVKPSGAGPMTGGIPAEIGNLEELQVLDLRSNLLTGPMPEELWKLPRLRNVDIQGNLLTGCVPQGRAEVTVLSDGLEQCAAEDNRQGSQ